MNVINNSFVRAIILIAIAALFFLLAKWFGAQNLGSEVVGAASMLVGVAAGALKDSEKQSPTPPEGPAQPKPEERKI